MDKYDRAIEILTKTPDDIRTAWTHWDDHPAGCLFNIIPDASVCLTEAIAMPEELDGHPLRDEIIADGRTEDEYGEMSDGRIPEDPDDITLDDLPVFAEWQRKIDALYPNRDNR